MKVGCGYDSHRLVEGRRLVLGGVEIPFEKGLLGHSDADALLHAVCDALLGAIGEGDIGTHFPDTDPAYRDIASLRLLEAVAGKTKEAGCLVHHVDATIIWTSKPCPLSSADAVNMPDLEIPGNGFKLRPRPTRGWLIGRERALPSWRDLRHGRKGHDPGRPPRPLRPCPDGRLQSEAPDRPLQRLFARQITGP